MHPDHDYYAQWPELFRDLPTLTRDALLATLRKSAAAGMPPSRTEASILVDFATGQISAREYGRRTLAHLMGEYADSEAPPEVRRPDTDIEPAAMAPPEVTVQPPPVPLMDHDVAALAFVRGEVTVEQYLQNARLLRRLA